METQKVYLGLGANLGDPVSTFHRVLEKLENQPDIQKLRCSPFYVTTPVSPIPQDDYLNAVCELQTALTLEDLRNLLAALENEFGKHPKDKDAPRLIDIDVLFYGTCRIAMPDFEVPHPRWMERLFVLRPLFDLTDKISFVGQNGQLVTVNLKDLLQNFINRHHEIVKKVPS